MHLYHLTVEPTQQWHEVVVGHFLDDGTSSQQIVVSRGSSLLVVGLAGENDTPQRLNYSPLLGRIWHIAKIRPAGSSVDFLVVTSDSGQLVILELQTSGWVQRLRQPFEKNGFNRTNAGEFMVVDPDDRCVMLAGLQSNRIIYPVAYSASRGVTVEAPVQLKVDVSSVILTMAAIDTRFENPMFVTVEADPDGKDYLKWYTFDQGLNIIRLLGQPTALDENNESYHLVQAPFGGVYVAQPGKIAYYSGPSAKSAPIIASIPSNLPIVCHATQTKKKQQFLLLQDTTGHLWRVLTTIDSEREFVEQVNVVYYETIEPCLSIGILRAGYLIANPVVGDVVMYLIESMGDESMDSWTPRQELKHLEVSSKIYKGSPVMDAALYNQTMILKSPQSTNKVRKGTPTSILVSSPLPFVPTSVFTTKKTRKSDSDEYLVITSSTESKTLVLSIGEVVENVKDSHFIETQPTVLVAQVGVSSLIQVYRDGINHIKLDGKQTMWHPPAGISVVAAAANNFQVVVALSDGALVYFEIDATDDQLAEYGERLEVDTGVTSLAMDLTRRANYVVVGTKDNEIQVVSLQENSCLEVLSIQALSATPSSLNLRGSHLSIGMESGVFVLNQIDPITGDITGTRKKFIGTSPVSLYSTGTLGSLVISSATWLLTGKGDLSPLLNLDLVCGAGFISEEIGGEAVVGINRRGELVIFNVGEEEETGLVTLGPLVPETVDVEGNGKRVLEDGDSFYVATSNGVQVVTESNVETIPETPDCSQATSMVRAKLKGKQYLFIALPGQVVSILVGEDSQYEYLHTTDTKLPGFQTLLGFQGRLLLGHGQEIRYYDVGLKQLLFKGATIIPQTTIVSLQNMEGDRLALGDIRRSVRIFNFDTSTQQFVAVADDTSDRHVTTAIVLDHTTVAGGDRFGNVWINELDDVTSKAVDSSWPLWIKSHPEYLQGAPVRLKPVAQYYVGDAIVKLCRGSLIYGGGQESLIYFGILGTIGVMLPLLTSSELKFFQSLSTEMAALYTEFNSQNLLGKDAIKSRGYYGPSYNVIDGDLLEQFHQQADDVKQTIATRLKRSVGEIERRLLEIRDRALP
ncbi:hypothetical protein DIURU_000732 [Diutina rugosa]|uniref:DNA damage-binding protein 1 n=1 Tax=Diutina rugosa TaxID=5481 RepID=A0A642UWM4_DIURU|nr:uncharacterized protein DIURU_000732 [Diutina rugosa]KAA8907048.1 hypothetical protein DIURU_000732 [Diutina rugosa]